GVKFFLPPGDGEQDLGAHPGNGNRRSASRSFFRGRGGRYPANFLLDTMACDDIAYDDRIPVYGADPLSAAQSNAESFGPLTPSMFHVLLALAGERSEEHTSELQSRGHLVCRL